MGSFKRLMNEVLKLFFKEQWFYWFYTPATRFYIWFYRGPIGFTRPPSKLTLAAAMQTRVAGIT